MSTHLRKKLKTELKIGTVTDADTYLDPYVDPQADAPSLSARVTWQLTIVSLFFVAFCLGFPQFHYTAALMIAAILRYKDAPGDIFAPISLP